MTIGERIKECREKLKMSQEELALQMGYTSRSTINKIEKGLSDVAQSKVIEFAKILKTTPEYLMGLNNDDCLTFEEKTLLNKVKNDIGNVKFNEFISTIYNMDVEKLKACINFLKK